MTKDAEGAQRLERWSRRRSGSVGTAGSGAPRKGDLGLPGAAEETGAAGRQTASGAWAGTAQGGERGTGVDAGDDGLRELALSQE